MADQIISTEDLSEEDTRREQAEESLEVETRRFVLPADMHGWRTDRALATLIPELSRSYLQQLMAEDAVHRNDALAHKPAAKVHVGDVLEIELRPTQQAMAFVAETMLLNVVYEDAHLMVIVKPAGLVVHPAAGHWRGTLLNGLLAYHTGAASLPRAGIVHRLDKDTSGLMLVGKSRQAVEALVRAIALREVKREYLAIGQGEWKHGSEVTVDQPIGRDVRNRLRMAVVSETSGAGKAAQTTLRPLSGNRQLSLVACRLHTGRTHQIRVHMEWLGHPLIADTLYGGRPALEMERQALHAARLHLRHPISGEAMAFEAPPPADFLKALDLAALQYNWGNAE